ncbi:GRWD1 [Cordylochernes scorpioides]|uniref:Glutamate-rich WD repeat-containing protein 1 n=1 Tax=Cordylochernes scorpioides TaxID=51811 RepID=A0ABY6LCH2_9ARAC|nr:GRWD1 [Cordylochernes scorpioides]
MDLGSPWVILGVFHLGSPWVILGVFHLGSPWVILEHPCMSFDVIQDSLGENRGDQYPLTIYLVSGTSMSNFFNNSLLPDTTMTSVQIEHRSCVNRIKVANLPGRQIAATWSDQGQVRLWDLQSHLAAVDGHPGANYHTRPIFTYALSWSSLVPGKLASGANDSRIFLWYVTEEGWRVYNTPPLRAPVLCEGHPIIASCSSDHTVNVWDDRTFIKSPVLSISAHNVEVNAIAWNKNQPHHLLSGGDDGVVKIWDLRNIKDQVPAIQITHHEKAINSVEWHPTNKNCFPVASGDNTVTHWDLSLEPEENVPRFHKFEYECQSEIKELHWHPQMAEVLITTANSGFTLYKPDYDFYRADYVMEEEDEE